MPIVSVFMEIQEGNCFYCKKPLNRNRSMLIILSPVSVSADLGHNFVLSHSHATTANQITLAAEEHLAAWMEQIRTQKGQIARHSLLKAELPQDLPASIRIANWAYEQTEKSAGQVWVEKKVLRHLGLSWRQLLSV